MSKAQPPPSKVGNIILSFSLVLGGALWIAVALFFLSDAIDDWRDFPLGTAGLALWLHDPLNSGFAVSASCAFLAAPLLHMRLWNRLFSSPSQSA